LKIFPLRVFISPFPITVFLIKNPLQLKSDIKI
jgi:hypothetical protein